MTALRSQQATNWREGRRLPAWELFQGGWHQQRIAEALGVSKGAVSQWLSWAKADGPQALHHRKPPGRRSKLTHQQRLQLLELLVQRPQALGFRGDVWTQPRVTQVIRRHFGVQYYPSQVGRILKQYNWSRQKPLKRASQRDEDAIQRWKEERWPALKKGQGRRPNHRLRRRDRLLPVAPGGKDLCPQGPNPASPGPSQPGSSVADQRHHRPWLAAHQGTGPALPWKGCSPFPAAPDHPHLGAAVGHLGWQSHSPVPGGQSFSGQLVRPGSPSGAVASLRPRVEPRRGGLELPETGRVEECHLSASGSAILRVGQGHQAAQAKSPHHSCLHCSGWSCLTLCSWVSKQGIGPDLRIVEAYLLFEAGTSEYRLASSADPFKAGLALKSGSFQQEILFTRHQDEGYFLFKN